MKLFPARWFANISLGPRGQEEIAALSGAAGVVHVFEQHSLTDFASLMVKYESIGWKSPKRIKSKPIYGKKENEKTADEDFAPRPGEPRALLLGKNRDVEILADLIALSRRVDYPIILAPQVVLYERTPAKAGAPGWWDRLFGPGGSPKLVRKWRSLLQSRLKVLISAGDTVNLKEFASKSEIAALPELAAARMLLDMLRMQFRDERRVVIGPRVPERERMKRLVKRHKTLVHDVSKEAASSDRSEWEVWNEVDRHLDEVMADYNVNYIRVWQKILTWVWRRFFGGVVVDNVGLERTRRAVRKGPVIYVPCHRSHADYLILSYVLFCNNMTAPHIAAGKNLSFWPLGHIFRKSGAFFMRRSFRDAGIYSSVFESYIRTIVREGFNVEFFIEGGRSRTGKMFLPKMGILGMFLRAFEEGELNDLSFIPISISYDRIPEEGELLGESHGAGKDKKGLIASIREMLKKNFGRIHVNFAPPISLREYITARNAEYSAMDVEPRRALYREFAFRVINAINEVSVIPPTSLLAASLLSKSSPGIEEDRAINDALTLFDYLDACGARLAPTFRMPKAALAEAQRIFFASRDIKNSSMSGDDTKERVLLIEPEKRMKLEYYKNGALHELYKPAFVACSLLSQRGGKITREKVEADFSMMSLMFKYEFVYSPNWLDSEEVERVFNIFRSWGLIEINEAPDGGAETWNITPRGDETIPLFSGLIDNFIEAYLFVIQTLPETYGEKEFDRDDCVKKLMKLIMKSFLLGRIKRRESISGITFKNAVALAAHLNMIELAGKDENGKETWRVSSQNEKISGEYVQTLKRLGRINGIN